MYSHQSLVSNQGKRNLHVPQIVSQLPFHWRNSEFCHDREDASISTSSPQYSGDDAHFIRCTYRKSDPCLSQHVCSAALWRRISEAYYADEDVDHLFVPWRSRIHWPMSPSFKLAWMIHKHLFTSQFVGGMPVLPLTPLWLWYHILLADSIQTPGLCSHYLVILCHPQLNTKMQHPNTWFWSTSISLLRKWPILGGTGHFGAHQVVLVWNLYVNMVELCRTSSFLDPKDPKSGMVESWQYSRDFQRFSRDCFRFSPQKSLVGFSVFRCPMRPWCLAPWPWSSPPRTARPSKAGQLGGLLCPIWYGYW